MADLSLSVQMLIVPLLVLGIGFAVLLPARRRRKGAPSPDRSDPLKDLARVELTVVPLMNGSELRLLRQLEELLQRMGGGNRLFAQVSMGEILKVREGGQGRSAAVAARNRFNAKRVDFLITDAEGLPVLALEYQGAGHYRGNAAHRDAIKREAFRRAGLPLLEVPQTGLGRGHVKEIEACLMPQAAVSLVS